MRVVHLVPHFEKSGNGVVNAAVDLACAQVRLGMKVMMVGAGEGSFRDLLEGEGVTVHSLPGTPTRKFFSFLPCVFKALRNFKPEIVHAHMVPGAIIGHLLRPGLRYKLIVSAHNSGRFGSRLMSLGDLVICVSGHLAFEMSRRGVPSKKIRVVRNGPLGSPRLPPGSTTGHQLNHPAIVTIAEPARHKGLGDLISAFSLVADRYLNATLYILGDGRERLAFERQAHATSCSERIIFCGFVADPTPYLQSSDIFVLASHREGFGLVLAEARRLGCAIIASDVGGIPEVLDGGSAGVLVPVRSPKLLALAMLELIQNPGMRDFYRMKAASNLEWLSCQRTATETAGVYNEAWDESLQKIESVRRLS
jgi:glycosyltransferase involved in cell wall biosynthesis